MRRSSAPSRLESSAKRGRFCPPFAKLLSQHDGNSKNHDVDIDQNPTTGIHVLSKDFSTGQQQQQKRSAVDLLKLIDNVDACVSEDAGTQAVCFSPLDPVVQEEPLKAIPDRGSAADKMYKSESSCRYFSVVWGKLSTRKHKKWEGDAVLIVKKSSTVLKDLNGKTIGTGSMYKKAQLEVLEDGSQLVIGGKEVEVMGTISTEDYESGRCFQSAACQSNAASENQAPTFTSSVPFRSPLMDATIQNCSKRQLMTEPMFDPTKPNALVLPRPNTNHQWQFNVAKRPVIDVVVDPVLSKKLRPHQKEGVIFLYECIMKMRGFKGQGAILADDMGLGKTLQCITVIWTLLKQGPYGGIPILKRVLIVTPSSLMKNWSKEFNAWLGRERINVYTAETSDKIKDYARAPIQPVLITSYELVTRNPSAFEVVSFDLVVCDEGHRLKNAATKTSSFLSSLPIERRIVLTGTPIQNDLQEFFTLVDFCNPGILGSAASFRKLYEDPILASRQLNAMSGEVKLGQSRAGELSHITGLFILRRTQDVNNEYLPPKVEYVVYCKPTALQLAIYQRLVSSHSVQSCLSGRDKDGSRHLRCITALKKLCTHPGHLYKKALEADDDSFYSGIGQEFSPDFEAKSSEPGFSGKLRVLASFLRSLHGTERVVLVSSYTSTLDLLVTMCRCAGFSFLRLDGSTPTDQRQALVDRFNASSSNDFAFLLSLKAGGVGLNLIGASRLVLLDVDWNPANDLQAMSRVWRDGQKKRVHIYRFLTTGTIEEKIFQRQITKYNLSGTLVDSKEHMKMQFTPEELKDLFTLNVDTLCNTHDLLECDCDATTKPAEHMKSVTDQALTRSCQLTLTKMWSKPKNLSMDELMSWDHLNGQSISDDLQESFLVEAKEDISFIFRNATAFTM